jgi:hypothetical protein
LKLFRTKVAEVDHRKGDMMAAEEIGILTVKADE